MRAPPEAAYRARLDAVPLSVLGTIVDRLAGFDGERYPLHQGKSDFAAPFAFDGGEAARLGHSLAHDGPPQGMPALLEAVAASLGDRLGRTIPGAQVQITNGITHGLNLAFGATLAPGDAVMMLSPQWLFARGSAAAWGAEAIEVPYFVPGRPADAAAIVVLLERHRTPRTRAIYFNTPNNPTGLSLARWEVAAIGAWARSHDLWVIADNAYDAFDYADGGFPDPAAADLAPERTLALYSCSKTFGWTGFRIGYMTMPEPIARAVRVLALHSIYGVSTAAQYVALQGFDAYFATVERHRDRVAHNLARLHRDCAIPMSRSDGGFYTLLDLTAFEGGPARFLDAAVARGVSLAPGAAFGHAAAHGARLCFTVVDAERLGAALAILNALYAEGRAMPHRIIGCTLQRYVIGSG